jgi:chromosomal replication initiator protein
MADERTPSIIDIQQAVCLHFRLRMSEMLSHRRELRVARPRQVAMYLAREMTPLSLPQIARRFDNRDHTTVLHACRLIPKLAADDSALAIAIADVRAAVLRQDIAA